MREQTPSNMLIGIGLFSKPMGDSWGRAWACVHVLVALAVSIGVSSGCARKLRVVTDPPYAKIQVRDTWGKVIYSQQAPAEFPVEFNRSNYRYIIEAQPTGESVRDFSLTSDEVTAVKFASLPVDNSEQGKGIRELKLKLQSSAYEQMYVVKLVLDPIKGWLGLVVQDRAYREVSEQGGDVPTRVVEFEEDFNITGLSLDPSGTRIVFSGPYFGVNNVAIMAAQQPGAAFELPLGNANLYGVEVNGGGVQHISTENFQDLFPSFTSDGESLLFCSNRRRPDSTDILQINAYGRGGISNVYVDHRAARAVKPSQAYDGTVAFCLYPAGWNKQADAQIWTVGGPVKFPTQIARGIHPQISPDGTYITYIGADGHVWVIDSDGTGATQLTHGADDILRRFKDRLTWSELAQYDSYQQQGNLMRQVLPFSNPSWSPDGGKILYTSMEGTDTEGRPNEDIWIMNRDGTGKRQLTTNGSVDRYPLMSPDGKYIYFLSNRGLKWAIWRIPAP